MGYILEGCFKNMRVFIGRFRPFLTRYGERVVWLDYAVLCPGHKQYGIAGFCQYVTEIWTLANALKNANYGLCLHLMTNSSDLPFF
ncbi:hypothetical protein D3C78_1327280 [compost metagenome]